MKTGSPSRIAAVDGLRAVAIGFVLLNHGWDSIPTLDLGFTTGAEKYVVVGAIGVQLFFVISGFLITQLLMKEANRTGRISLRDFYVRRILRIFPAFYCYLLTIAILSVTGCIQTTAGDIVSAGTFTMNYKHAFNVPSNDDYWFVAHFWTLALEEQFYLLWPATILLVGIARAHRVAVVLILLAPLVRVATYFLWPAARGHNYMMLHTAIDTIMFGCLAALVQRFASFERIAAKFSSPLWPLATVAIYFSVSRPLMLHYAGAYALTFGLSLNCFLMAFLLLWITRHPDSGLCRVLALPLLRHIGVLSYSLYLWQQLFLTPKNHTWSGLFLWNYVAVFAVAEASYWLVERPFLRLSRHFRHSELTPRPPDAIAAPF